MFFRKKIKPLSKLTPVPRSEQDSLLFSLAPETIQHILFFSFQNKRELKCATTVSKQFLNHLFASQKNRRAASFSAYLDVTMPLATKKLDIQDFFDALHYKKL